jgi:hypothetical protein
MSIIETCDQGYVNCQWDIFDPKPSFIIDGDWSYAEKKFTLPEGKTFSFSFKGDDLDKQKIYIDNFLLRKAGSDVYRIENGVLTKNGVRF